VNYPNFLLTQISQGFLLHRLPFSTPSQALRAVPSLIATWLSLLGSLAIATFFDLV